jgi:hypothetical protein
MNLAENNADQEKNDYFPRQGDVVAMRHPEIPESFLVKLQSVNKIDDRGNVSPQYQDVTSVYIFSELPATFESKYPRATQGFFYEHKDGSRVMLHVSKVEDLEEGVNSPTLTRGTPQQH